MTTRILFDNTTGKIKDGDSDIASQLDTSQAGVLSYSTSWQTIDTSHFLRNRIANGGMTVAQRGSSAVTLNGAKPVDLWGFFNNTTAVASSQQSSVCPPGFSKSISVSVSSGVSATAVQYATFQHNIEGYNIEDLLFGTASAKPITISFWVKSSVVGTYGVSIRNSATNRAYASSYSLSTTDWEYKKITIPGDVTGSWLSGANLGFVVNFDFGSGSNYRTSSLNSWLASGVVAPTSQANFIGTTGATMYLTGVQLEAGTVATPFEVRPIQYETSLCQRYFVRFSANSGQPYVGVGIGNSSAIYIKFRQQMRAKPTFTMSGMGNLRDTTGIVSATLSSAPGVSLDSAGIVISATNLTSNSYSMLLTATDAGYLDMSAEL